jgi:uncharacterized membrane protein YbhN (UPF0104 family)
VRRLIAVARWVVPIAVSVGIVTYILVDVNRQHLWRAMAAVRLPWVALAVAVYLLGQAISAVKWALIGRSVGLAGSTFEYVRFYFAGMFFNLIGFATVGGDVVRALYLGRGRRPGLALNSVLFDRMSGLVVLMAMSSITLLCYPEYHFAGPISFIIMAGGLVLVAAWWTCPRLVRLLPPSGRIRVQVETELAPFWRDSWLLVRIAAVSLVFHLSQVCVQWLLARAAGASVPFSYCLVFHPMLCLMLALPLSIGGFGVREGGYLYFLGRLQVDDSVAVTMGLLWWGVTVVAALVGIVIFVASGAELPSLRLGRDEEALARH